MSRILIELGSPAPRPGHLGVGLAVGEGLPLDFAKGLPFPDGSVDGIHSERYLEALPRPAALALLRECRRALRPGGVLRVVPEPGPAADALPALATAVGLEVRGRNGAALELTPAERPLRRTGEALVSVVIPAYNPAFFRECLESALGQTYRNLEIVVSDDCPGDGIESIVREYVDGDPRIRYRHNRPSLGALPNFVDSFRIARGEYVKFINDDDRLHPTCVERMAAVLDREPGITQVTSHRQVIDVEGRFLPDLDGTRRVVKRDSTIDGRVAIDTVLSRRFFFIGHPTGVMFRAADVRDVEPHLFCLAGHEFPWSGDVALAANLLSRGDLAYLVDSLSYFRVQPDQLSQNAAVIRGCAQEWPLLRQRGAEMGFLVPGASTAGGVRALRLADAAAADQPGPDPAVFHPGATPLAVEGVRPVRLLLVPEWGATAWKGAFQAFLRAFGPGDPVSLILRVDPADPARVDAACRAVEAAMREAGVAPERAPDVVLEASEIPAGDRGRLYTAASALLLPAGARETAAGREARACGRPVVECTGPDALRAVAAALLASGAAGSAELPIAAA